MGWWLICCLAVVTGFVVGRWWAIGAVVLVMTVVWMTHLPAHASSPPFENSTADLGWIVDLLLLVNVFLNAIVLAVATAAGWGARLLARRLIFTAAPLD
jgi:hypothetical protein